MIAKRHNSGIVRWASLLATTLLMFCASGASCPQMIQQYTQPAPRVLPRQASLEQVFTAVNANSDKIHMLAAPQASISVAGFPSLRANIAMELPRRFRLKAGTSLTGDEVDLGSNDQLFWLWIRRNQPPAFYFCRHEQFATSSARQIFPVEPQWLTEALGVVHLEPGPQYAGPTPVGSGRLQIDTSVRTATGDLKKVTVVDDSRAWVLEQHLYDAQGQRLASSVTSQHRRDPASGAFVPRHIEIQWPPASMSMKIDLGEVQVNVPDETGKLYVKPELAGYPNVDLADPNIQFGPPPQQPRLGAR